jgi:hypothetical protein
MAAAVLSVVTSPLMPARDSASEDIAVYPPIARALGTSLTSVPYLAITAS